MTDRPIAQQPSPENPIITAPRGSVTVLSAQVFLAALAALALRLLFVLRFPASAGDSDLYFQLSRSLLDHHSYGLWLNGQLIPTDLRVPGYPAFLAGVTILLRRSAVAISLSQVLLDMATCFLTAALAAALAPRVVRRRVWLAGLWLAATCPFVANYSAVILTEVLATFFTTAALVCFVLGLGQIPRDLEPPPGSRRMTPFQNTVLGAFLTGLATMVRPEMPLLLAVAGLIYAVRWWRVVAFRKLLLQGSAMAGALMLPLLPWAARNFFTLHEVQFISPRYATLPGEYAPIGYYAWTGTWLERYRDAFSSVWAISEEPMSLDDTPAAAFDSPGEKARVAALFDAYNRDPGLDISPEVDREFAQIARERTRRHPFRTYVRVPFQRALTLWFTPRVELLPIDGNMFPLRDQWQDSRANVITIAVFAALGYLYVALAFAGIWFARREARAGGASDSRHSWNSWGIALIVAYCIVRTAFLTTVEAPEPRYVVSCYPAVLSLIALLFAGRERRASQTLGDSSTGRGFE
ncbi:MAG: hypothetical protein LAO19_21045 [Acidobacteriia bacterium]|nr:hypothetical protein [Terriglobia bacterium]